MVGAIWVDKIIYSGTEDSAGKIRDLCNGNEIVEIIGEDMERKSHKIKLNQRHLPEWVNFEDLTDTEKTFVGKDFEPGHGAICKVVFDTENLVLKATVIWSFLKDNADEFLENGEFDVFDWELKSKRTFCVCLISEKFRI